MVYTQYNDAYSLPSSNLLTSRYPLFGEWLSMQTGQYEYVLLDITAGKVTKIYRTGNNYNNPWQISVYDDDNITANVSVPTAVYGNNYVVYGGYERYFNAVVGGVLITAVIWSVLWGLIKRCFTKVR